MGSFLGNIGHAITKGVSDVGHVVGKVADNPLAKTLAAAALGLTGAGIPASMAIMGGMGAAGGALKPGGGLKQAVGGGVTGAASGALASKLGSMARGAYGAMSAAGGGGHGGIADASVGGDGSGGGSGGGLLDRLKGFAGTAVKTLAGGGGGGGSEGGGTSLLDKLLMGGTVAAGAMDEAQKRGMQNKASDYATSAYDAKAPIRGQALAALAAPPTVDPRIAAASADPGNVYDRARRARMLAAAATPPAPVR